MDPIGYLSTGFYTNMLVSMIWLILRTSASELMSAYTTVDTADSLLAVDSVSVARYSPMAAHYRDVREAVDYLRAAHKRLSHEIAFYTLGDSTSDLTWAISNFNQAQNYLIKRLEALSDDEHRYLLDAGVRMLSEYAGTDFRPVSETD